jgi:hypothetical protein
MSAVASRAFANQRIEGLRYLTQQERDAEAEMLRTNTFDWFVADFNEALSAFSGDVLWEQTEFINDCVNYILSFYEKNLPKRHYKVRINIFRVFCRMCAHWRCDDVFSRRQCC